MRGEKDHAWVADALDLHREQTSHATYRDNATGEWTCWTCETSSPGWKHRPPAACSGRYRPANS